MIKNSKKRLFATARHLFAIKGYQETSTRDIADEAKVNISAITYYFGSKLELYGAVLSDIACRVKKELHEKTEHASNLLAADETSPQEAETLLFELISDLCSLLCSKRLPNEDAVIFLREYSVPGEAFDTLYQELISPVYRLFSDLIVKATGNALNNEDAALYTFQLFAQMFVFQSRKQTILQHLNWQEYGEREIKKITDMILNHTRAVLALYKNQHLR